ALLPDIISKLTRAGLTVAIESGAGIHAGAGDEAFTIAGAEVFPSTQHILSGFEGKGNERE
ncbi:MAG: hypothetical protein EBV19_09830, partial [Flavobacteriia bacterium]|nr:hypothetical protein [Flavobacteriia bacterium]